MRKTISQKKTKDTINVQNILLKSNEFKQIR